MLNLCRGISWTPVSWRRAAAAALMALQAVLALSPMLERRETTRRDTHVESLGSRHLLAHDDATCTICAARTLIGDAPAQSAAFRQTATRGCVDAANAAAARLDGVPQDNQSRAPPKLG